jgi:hypothetical protein
MTRNLTIFASEMDSINDDSSVFDSPTDSQNLIDLIEKMIRYRVIIRKEKGHKPPNLLLVEKQ